jgi:hypothetical protein
MRWESPTFMGPLAGSHFVTLPAFSTVKNIPASAFGPQARGTGSTSVAHDKSVPVAALLDDALLLQMANAKRSFGSWTMIARRKVRKKVKLAL